MVVRNVLRAGGPATSDFPQQARAIRVATLNRDDGIQGRGLPVRPNSIRVEAECPGCRRGCHPAAGSGRSGVPAALCLL